MRIEILMDPTSGEQFLNYLSSVRTRAANELVAAQREVDVARMTNIVEALGNVSRGLALALERHAATDVAFRERKKLELRTLRAQEDV